jgi:hypothetical protein
MPVAHREQGLAQASGSALRVVVSSCKRWQVLTLTHDFAVSGQVTNRMPGIKSG